MKTKAAWLMTRRFVLAMGFEDISQHDKTHATILRLDPASGDEYTLLKHNSRC